MPQDQRMPISSSSGKHQVRKKLSRARFLLDRLDDFWTRYSLTMDLIDLQSHAGMWSPVIQSVSPAKNPLRTPYPLAHRGYPLNFSLEKLSSYFERLPSKPLWRLVRQSRKLAKVLL